MDHSTLHKANLKKMESEANRNGKKVRRRSFVQKQKRGMILDKQRNMSPLKESNKQTVAEKRRARAEQLKVWKEERKKKKDQERQNAKPAFKVSKAINRGLSKENKTAKEVPARNTRSKKVLTEIKKEARKPASNTTKSVVKPVEEPPKVDTELSSNKHPPRVNTQLSSNNHSESFAPKDFQFKPLSGLTAFRFDSALPNSNESFVSKGGAMNFISSTPRLPNAVARTKTAPPMVFSSASASSSEENSKPVTNDKVPKSSPKKDKEDEKNKEHSTSFKIISEDTEKVEKLQYFRNLISTESENLKSSCKIWEDVQVQEKESLTEEVIGEIRTVIGQAQLLMAERFVQFAGLVDKFETPKPDHNPVTPADLKGFWEMIYFQVEDVVKKFNNLESLKAKNWQKEEEITTRVTRKRKASTKASKCSSAHRRAAKQRLKAAREAMLLRREQLQKNDDNKTSLSKTIPEKAICAESIENKAEDGVSSQEEGVMTRSKRKTPAGRNVSFVTPRSKKRKARFAVDETDHDSISTPTGSLPRKRVMRKTPLPGSKPESGIKGYQSEGELSSCNGDDVQASPMLKKQISSPPPQLEIENEQDEIKGMKLNFDDVESDGEDNVFKANYLVSSELVSDGVRSSCIGLGEKYLLPTDTDSPIPRDSLSDVNVPTKSPGRVLRSSRKSYQNPMSPFLPKNQKSGAVPEAGDLMSFSPLPSKYLR